MLAPLSDQEVDSATPLAVNMSLSSNRSVHNHKLANHDSVPSISSYYRKPCQQRSSCLKRRERAARRENGGELDVPVHPYMPVIAALAWHILVHCILVKPSNLWRKHWSTIPNTLLITPIHGFASALSGFRTRSFGRGGYVQLSW
ncbi:hypothetical protein KC315_g27 [Hortaea werneckii]|nr:hypothetical protein KC315_g27 [Hortaea werneckii]